MSCKQEINVAKPGAKPDAESSKCLLSATKNINKPEEGSNDTDGLPYNNEDFDTDCVPYDRGWAWMIVFGNFINYVLISGYVKSSGVFFVELLRHFRAPASKTALLFALRGGVHSITGLFVMNAVVGRLGCRKTVLIGAVLMSLSAILSSLANELTLLITLQAVLLGVADSMVTSPGEVLTAAYFRKRRSLAMAMTKTGASIGSICYPPLLTHLVSHYGLRGALVMTGAVSLHSLPAALLLRPISYYRKARAKRCDKETRHGVEKDMMSVTERDDDLGHSKKLRKPGFDADDLINSTYSIECGSEKITVKRKAATTCDENHRLSLSDQCLEAEYTPFMSAQQQSRPTTATNCGRGSNVPNWELADAEPAPKDNAQNLEQSKHLITTGPFPPQDPEKEITINTSTELSQYPGPTKLPRQTIQRTVFVWFKSSLSFLDFSLFGRSWFRVFFVYSMLAPTVNVAVDYLPALAQHHQLTETQAAHLLSVVGGVDLASRFLSGMLADLGIVPVPTMVSFALAILGVTYQCVRLMTSFRLLLVLAVLQGLMAGVVNCTVSLLVLHVVGLQHMAKGIGFQTLAEGAFLAAFHPLCGYIRDITGSYEWVYNVIGCALLVAAALLTVEELIRRRMDRQLPCSADSAT